MYYRLQNIENKKGVELIELVATIAPSVTDLDLTGIGLYSLNGEELVAFMKAIPVTVTSLNLSNNNLSKMKCAELVACLSALPLSISCLNLSNNWLNQWPNDELITMVANIPPSVSSLNLSDNYLGIKKINDLIAVINAIPSTVTSLDLSSSFLHRKMGAELKELLRTFPSTINSLKLSQNNLHKVAADFVAAVAVLPETLSSLDLSRNDFNVEQLDAIMFEIPFNVESINLYPLKPDAESFIQTIKPITINDYYAKRLVEDVADLIAQQGVERFSFDTVETDLLIDGFCLNRLIEILEKQNLPITDLTCGLLVEGQIEQQISVLNNCNEYEQHMEKRTHDAISFYTKAGRDVHLKPVVKFLLRNITMNCASTSVQNRLAFYDLTSEGGDSCAKKTSNCIVTPLLASFGVFSPLSPESDECRVTTACQL